jgi:hypothetical protein
MAERLVRVLTTQPAALDTVPSEILFTIVGVLEAAANDPARDDGAAFFARLALEDEKSLRVLHERLPLPRLDAYIQRHGGNLPTAAVVAAIEGTGEWDKVLYAMNKTGYAMLPQAGIRRNPVFKQWVAPYMPPSREQKVETALIVKALARRGGPCHQWLVDEQKFATLFPTIDVYHFQTHYIDTYFYDALAGGWQEEDALLAAIGDRYDIYLEPVRSVLEEKAASGGYVKILRYFTRGMYDNKIDSLFENAVARGHINVLEYLKDHLVTYFATPIYRRLLASAIALAFENNHLAVVRWLGDHFSFRMNRLSWSDTLGECLRYGKLDMAEFLYEHGIRGAGVGGTSEHDANTHVLTFEADVSDDKCMAALDWLARRGIALPPARSLVEMGVLMPLRAMTARRLVRAGHPVQSDGESREHFLELYANMNALDTVRWLIQEAGYRRAMSARLMHIVVAQRDVNRDLFNYLVAEHCPMDAQCVRDAVYNGHTDIAATLTRLMAEQNA